jgi:CheY-like chemotaxis protein
MTLRIVLIDDDDDSRELLGMLLASLGHEVREAASGTEGLVLLADEPDMALVDLELPDLGGLAIAQRIRACGRALPVAPRLEPARTVLVALSGHTRDADREAAHASGFDHHLAKPVDLPRLRALLDLASRSRA